MNKHKNILRFFTLVIIFIWTIKIYMEKMPYADLWTRSFVEYISKSHFYTFARLITELGSDTFLIPFTAVFSIVLFLLYKHWIPSVIFGGGTLLSHLINMSIKMLVARERPSINIGANAEGYSFPSGHAMISMVCYGLLLFFLSNKIPTKKYSIFLKTVFVLLIACIGISRYIINVHYLTDVIVGFCLGYLLLICFIRLYKWLNHRYCENQTLG